MARNKKFPDLDPEGITHMPVKKKKEIPLVEAEKTKRKKQASDYARIDLITDECDYKSYVSIMSRAEGISMTKYIQNLIKKDMEDQKDRYEKLKELL